jgi:CitB family two-component system response regulator MalR
MIKVLIIEDDPMVAEFNKRYLLQVEGFVVVATARSAEEAFPIVQAESIDLILLDLFLPGTNGMDFLFKLREMDKNMDVIVVSAACDWPSIQQTLRYGVVDFLIKPFEFERLKTALVAYRERSRFIKTQPTLIQTDLDQYILRKKPEPAEGLPKGLDRNTLKVVWECIRQQGQDSFETNDIAKCLGISRVSIRKYLHFLHGQGLLSLDVAFGSIGRPVYRYCCIRPDNDFIKHFL